MFPIRDHNPSGRTPYVVYALIAANILIFLSYVGMMDDNEAMFNFFSDWAITPNRVADGRHIETLVTSMFLHGGWMHLGGNMLFLWIFGDNIEDEMGHVKFALFYLVCGVGSGLIHVLSAPYSNVPTVGASGAIAGVLGGYLLLYPKAKVDVLVIFIVFFRIFPIPAWIMLGLWFAMQIFGSIGADPNAGGVAYWAHIGGFGIGLMLTSLLWLKLGGTRFWKASHGHPPHPKHQYAPSRIPKTGRK